MRLILVLLLAAFFAAPAEAHKANFCHYHQTYTDKKSGRKFTYPLRCPPRGLMDHAHIAKGSGGDNPVGAILHARSMNKRRNWLVVRDTCQSSCWIKWNLVKRKCFYGQTPTFGQHEYTAKGTKVNVHSRSANYWRRMGREGPGDGWVTWRPPAKYRCPKHVLNMPSTDGRGGARPRKRGRTPTKFRIFNRN